MLTVHLALLAATLSLTPEAAALETAPANAGCLIRSDDKVLLVRDVWSQRWGLPGGGFEPGEAPCDTAARETWEETGLHAVPSRHLGTTSGGFQAWACDVAGPVSMAGPDIVALPDHARGEVAEARFINPETLAPAELRFPSQALELRGWAAATVPIDPSHLQLRTLPDAGPLTGALWLSRALAAPELPIMRAALLLASGLAALPAIALIVVWLAGWAGWRQAAELLLMTALAAFSAAVLKDLVAMPRPGDLDAALASTQTRGFGFPSRHATVVTCLWGALAARTALPGSRWAAAAAIAVCSLARLGLGAHFIHDMAGGICLAGGGVMLHSRALQKSGRAWLSGRAWSAIWAVAIAAAAVVGSLGPDQVLALGAALGCAAAAGWAPTAVSEGHSQWRPCAAGDGRLGGAAAAVALMLATAAGGALAAPREATFFASLAHRAGLALCLGAALPLGAALTGWRHRRAPSHAPSRAPRRSPARPVRLPGPGAAEGHLTTGQSKPLRRGG